MDDKQRCLQMYCQKIRAAHIERIFCGIGEVGRQTAKLSSISSGDETTDKCFDWTKGLSGC